MDAGSVTFRTSFPSDYDRDAGDLTNSVIGSIFNHEPAVPHPHIRPSNTHGDGPMNEPPDDWLSTSTLTMHEWSFDRGQRLQQ